MTRHVRPRRLDFAPVLAVLLLGPLASCGGDAPRTGFDDAACERALNGPDAVDAFDWLKAPSGGEKRFAGFSTDQGLAFAHQLLGRGARRVEAVGISKVPGPEPFEEARGWVVELPDASTTRRGVFELHAEHVRGQGFQPQADTGQRYLWFPGNRVP